MRKRVYNISMLNENDDIDVPDGYKRYNIQVEKEYCFLVDSNGDFLTTSNDEYLIVWNA